MTQTVAVVDYGMGNLRSVSQAVAHVARELDVRVIVTANPEEVLAAERVVLPGQGAMRDCMRELGDSGLLDAVEPSVPVCGGRYACPPDVGRGTGRGLVLLRAQLPRRPVRTAPHRSADRLRRPLYLRRGTG